MPRDTIEALCTQILLRHDRPLGERRRATVDFVVEVLARQPPWVRWPVRLLTRLFDTAALLHGGRRFARLPPARQRRWFALWAESGFPPGTLLTRFYESLVLLHAADVPGRDANAVRRSPLALAPTLPRRAEVVVIGSGPGGAVTAERLAAAGRAVVLIEEGAVGPERPSLPFSPDEMLRRCRHGGVDVTVGTTPIAYVEGSCIGGGSEINSGFFHRTPTVVLARWRREFGLRDAEPARLDDHFAACEAAIGAALHSGTPPAAAERLAVGAARLGWRTVRVPKGYRHRPGAAWRDDDRAGYRTMATTLLPRFVEAGGQLVAGVRARRVRKVSGGWEVEAGSGMHRATIRADQVFVAAGAVHTPALLRRSGLRRNIGDSLALQPMLKVIAEFPEPVNGPGTGIGEHQVREFAPAMTFACATSSPAQLALGLAHYPEAARRLAADWERMAAYTVMVAAQGRGTVRALPGCADPFVRYRLAGEDLRALGIGLKRLGRLLFAAGAIRLYPALELGGAIESADALERLPDDVGRLRPRLVTVHLSSSCPMGENAALCATDSYGRVHGTTGLYVADASLLCTAPGVNPQGSIMAFARRNAAHFIG